MMPRDNNGRILPCSDPRFKAWLNAQLGKETEEDRDNDLMLEGLRDSISKNLDYFKDLSSEEIMNERKNKFLKIGRNKGFISNSEDLSTLTVKQDKLSKILKSKFFLIGSGIAAGLVLFLVILNLF